MNTPVHQRKKVALYGGSFNPPHVVHQMICLYALTTQDIDEVWLMPCYSHPFGKVSVSFEHRVALCNLAATLLHPQVQVCTIEKDLPLPNYTWNTVQALQKKHPTFDFSLIMGSDVYAERSRWYRFDELSAKIPILVVGRGETMPSSPQVSFHFPNISSTRIREMIEKKLDVQAYIPRLLLSYIQEHNLYFTSSNKSL